MFAGVLQEYLKLRSQHVASLKAAGESPYPHKFQVTISLTDFIEKYENIDAGQTLPDLVSVAGRLICSHYWGMGQLHIHGYILLSMLGGWYCATCPNKKIVKLIGHLR